MLAFVAGLALVAGCSGGAGPDASATIAQLDAATARYAGFVHAMAADSIAAMYTPDGEMLGTGMHAIQSPDSIRAFLAAFTNVKVDSQAMNREAITIGDTVSVVWGTYTQVATVTGHPPVHVAGRFVAQWVRRAGEPWKIRRMLTQPAPVER
ncbi:MAG TPA: nuclear transport factor 2 family protein [Dongiaceae bacterium]|nr:nuclear transport factor 2 family protein [Dongiaceae bacterium]